MEHAEYHPRYSRSSSSHRSIRSSRTKRSRSSNSSRINDSLDSDRYMIYKERRHRVSNLKEEKQRYLTDVIMKTAVVGLLAAAFFAGTYFFNKGDIKLSLPTTTVCKQHNGQTYCAETDGYSTNNIYQK